MTKKTIALIRTSTEKQEVESQKKEIINAILKDGISENDIIVVGQSGASAIKVDDNYKKNMQTVYDLINEGNIANVYAWGIDRIGRNEEILFQFKNFLIQHKVQLVIINPSLRLLNEDGSVNNGVELAFSLFATMAKQEMETKKARFSRAKKTNAENGKFNGGKIHFGYKVINGKYEVDEEEKNVVKLIFDLYNGGEYSTPKLAVELQKRGIKQREKAITLHFVTNVLKDTAYIGYSVYNGVKRIYPQIISETKFNDAQKRLKANHKGDITKQTKHIHLASKLIVCTGCGRHFFASNRSYYCIGHKYHGKNIMGHETCNNGESISVEWLDVAAWYVAKSCEINYIYNFTESKAEDAQKQIEVNKQKIHTLEEKINKIEERRKRIALMFINDEITADEQKRQSEKIKSDVKEYHAQIVTLNEENEKLNNIVNYNAEGVLIRLGRLSVSGIYEDVENAYKITHKHLRKITIEPYIYQGKTQKLITITTIMGSVKRFLYIAKSKIKKDGIIYKLFREEKEKVFVPLFANKDFVPFDTNYKEN